MCSLQCRDKMVYPTTSQLPNHPTSRVTCDGPVLVERKARLALQLRQPPLFQPHVVGIVQIINADDSVPIGQQKLGDFGGNEAGNAGHKEVHNSTP